MFCFIPRRKMWRTWKELQMSLNIVRIHRVWTSVLMHLWLAIIFDTHDPNEIFFGRNMTEKATNQMILCFRTSLPVLQHYFAKEKTQKTTHWCLVHATRSNCCSALDFLSPEPCPQKVPSWMHWLQDLGSHTAAWVSRESKRLRLCFRRCLFVCLLATLRKKFRTHLHEIFKEGWQWANKKWLNFSGDPDHCLGTTGMVFRIRHHWEIRKVVNRHKSAAHTDSPDGSTGKTYLGEGMRCPVHSFKVTLKAASEYLVLWLNKSSSDWLIAGTALIQPVKNAIFVFCVLPGSAEAQVTWGSIVKRLLIAYVGIAFLPKISRFTHVLQSYSKSKVGVFETRSFVEYIGLGISLKWLYILMPNC